MAGRKPKSALPSGRQAAVGHSDFAALLADVKDRIQAAQTRAVLAVNAELVRLYWDIGRMIADRQRREGWGAAVIPRLALKLKNELPDLKGFSERNIKRMLAFHRDYPDPIAMGQESVAQLPASAKVPPPAAQLIPSPKVPQPVAQLREPLLWSVPWAHHVILMDKVPDLPTRRWYMAQTLANGWSRNVLALQIEARAHARHGKAVSNFAALLPAPQSDLAQQTLKDPYIFDFLTLTEPFQERELETELVRHLEKFLLELGQGFAFVGRQYRLDVGDEDFYIDLLFYHLRLRAFVVIDLKKGKFKPEYAGKLHPVRYADAATIPLRVCASQSQRRTSLRRSNQRSPCSCRTTRSWHGSIDNESTPPRVDLLRSLPFPGRRIQTRKVSENRVGEALSQDKAERLSHGVHPVRYADAATIPLRVRASQSQRRKSLLSHGVHPVRYADAATIPLRVRASQSQRRKSLLSHGVNFYCNVVNDRLKHPTDAPTIGLILCQTRDRLLAEYSFAGIDKPIGISTYELTRALPARLQSVLPTVEEIEAELAPTRRKR